MLEITPPKLYVNGFPKSGLHLSTQMVNCLFEPVSTENNWYGTNAWTLSKYSLDKAVDKFSEIEPRHFLKGHTGYMSELDELCNVLRVAMLLIYRDLRDVVVSQTYHILSESVDLNHFGRRYYDHLDGDKSAIMLEVITGNEYMPGIIDRWNDYSPWMARPYVMAVKYGDMVKRPHDVAKRFFNWVHDLATQGSDTYIDKKVRSAVVETMVSVMKKKDISVTYRRGKTGEWKREFTSEHVAAFKEADKDNVLYSLGYTKRANW